MTNQTGSKFYLVSDERLLLAMMRTVPWNTRALKNLKDDNDFRRSFSNSVSENVLYFKNLY